MHQKKPRATTVTFDFGTPVNADGTVVRPDGTIDITKDGEPLVPADSWLRVAYERSKGPKVLSEVYFGSAPPVGDPNFALLRFSMVFACDTSTKLIGDTKVSVAAVYEAQRIWKEPSAVRVRLQPRVAFEFRSIEEAPEKVAWSRVLRAYKGPTDVQICLVVDAHLTELPDINARRRPIIQNEMLPSWATLSYASADGGKEYVGNRLISECDREASRIIGFIEQGRIRNDQGLVAVRDSAFTHLRVWHPNLEDDRLRGYRVDL